MATVNLRPVGPDDFRLVYPLLLGFGSDRMTREDWWQMLFAHRWSRAQDPAGYALLQRDRVVGFIGTIFSYPRLEGRERRCCNLSSWIVRPEFRMHALRMLPPVLADAETTFTCLSLIDATVRIFRRHRFGVLDDRYCILTPFSGASPRTRRAQGDWTASPQALEKHLSLQDLEIYTAHRHTRARHLLLRRPEGDCYVVSTPWRLRGQVCAQLHHISDVGVFHGALGWCQRVLHRAYGSHFSLVDRRLLAGRSIRWSLERTLPRPRLFRSSPQAPLWAAQVSSLYSELMFLRN